MGKKLSKWIENTVGKGEIAHYEQFLLFPQFPTVFSKDLYCRQVKTRHCLGKGSRSVTLQDNQSVQIPDSMR